jgi:transcriptional regulator GlxA family with amidase domain
MGENAFIRLFSSQIGKPPQQYYREKRIERACWLLNNSKASIEQIANETGFVDRYHFSKVFKTSTGETPASYRRLRQKGKA